MKQVGGVMQQAGGIGIAYQPGAGVFHRAGTSALPSGGLASLQAKNLGRGRDAHAVAGRSQQFIRAELGGMACRPDGTVGGDGALAGLIHLVFDESGAPSNAMFFWLTGMLSSFLDNAPTYLVFFNTAGGDAQVLMNEMANTLIAISAGAVFMGANTYIGNAPNFMVRSIAEDQGVKMPSFFGYMAWSCGILVPLFLILTLIFF